MSVSYKVAILIDGGFFISRFKRLHQGNAPIITDMQPFIDDLIAKAHLRNI